MSKSKQNSEIWLNPARRRTQGEAEGEAFHRVEEVEKVEGVEGV